MFLRKSIADPLLIESHAYEAMASTPTHHSNRLDDPQEISMQVVSALKIPPKFAALAFHAFGLIRTLRAMGLNDTELGKIVGSDRFDVKSQSYPKLEKRLAEEREKQSLTDDGDFRIVSNALIAKLELERYAMRHKAQRYAREALDRLRSDLSNPH